MEALMKLNSLLIESSNTEAVRKNEELSGGKGD
jgi:hypothetical protein